MKHFAAAVVIAFSALTLSAQSPLPDLSGSWKVAADFGGTASDSVCMFKQDAGKLTGTCKGEESSMDLTGIVAADGITWTGKVQYNGQELTVTYKAKLTDPKTLSGSIDVQPMDVQGTFSAMKDTGSQGPAPSSNVF
jgi:hypothetical protein